MQWLACAKQSFQLQRAESIKTKLPNERLSKSDGRIRFAASLNEKLHALKEWVRSRFQGTSFHEYWIHQTANIGTRKLASLAHTSMRNQDRLACLATRQCAANVSWRSQAPRQNTTKCSFWNPSKKLKSGAQPTFFGKICNFLLDEPHVYSNATCKHQWKNQARRTHYVSRSRICLLSSKILEVHLAENRQKFKQTFGIFGN